MTINKIKTGSTSVKWMVSIYGFNSSVPNPTDFLLPQLPSAVIGSDATSVDDLIKNTVKQIKDYKNNPNKKLKDTDVQKGVGVKGIRFNRSKKSPSSECTITYKGVLPKYIQAGNWILVYSYMNGKNGVKSKFIRFCGQIHSINYDYSTTGEGLISKTFTIFAREWSSVLESQIKYDKISLQANITSPGGLIAAMGNGGASLQKDLIKQMGDFFSPFELAQFILSLIGCVNQDDAIKSITTSDGKSVLKLPSLALSAPSIPKSVMLNMGLSDPNPKDAFSTGFVKVVAGYAANAYASGVSGNWNGLFNKNGIYNYATSLKNAYVDSKLKPTVNGLGALTQLVYPAWSLIQNYCDPATFEYFTDMWYEKGDDGEIISQPVIVMRDKPFLMNKVLSNYLPQKKLLIEPVSLSGFTTNDLKEFSKYDNIPRISIPSEYILNISLSNTILNSPNYISIEFPDLAAKELQSSLSAAIGRLRLPDEMARFGGREMRYQTNFVGVGNYEQNETSFQKVFDSYKWLAFAWHGFDYRFAEGSILIKDFNTPISVGMNVRFKLNSLTLVGQVEGYSTDFSINAAGLESTLTQIQLSHIVKEVVPPAISPVGLQLGDGTLGSLASIVGSGLNALSGSSPISPSPSTPPLDFLTTEEMGNLLK